MSAFFFFFFNDTATTEIYTLSLHDALPISFSGTASERKTPATMTSSASARLRARSACSTRRRRVLRSEEHTSELQSPCNLVCRLLLEKKKDRIDATRLLHHSRCVIDRARRM